MSSHTNDFKRVPLTTVSLFVIMCRQLYKKAAGAITAATK